MTWGFTAVAAATVVGAKIGSNAASSAAATQVQGARDAADTALEGTRLQIAADATNLQTQITAADNNLTRTLAAQATAVAAGNTAAAEALDKQIAAQRESLDKQIALQRELYNAQVETLRPFKEAGVLGQNRLLDVLGLSGNTTAEGYGSAAKSFTAADMEKDPGYAFRVEEGQKAIDRSAASRGGLQSGAALRAAARYGQDMGSQEYANAFNRYQTERSNQLSPLQSLQAVGQASAAGQATAAGNLSSGSSQALQNYGSGASAAYGNYGSTVANNASQLGAGASSAYGNYGSTIGNAYSNSNAARQSAYGTGTANAVNAITGAANASAAGQIGAANAWTNSLGGLTNLYGMYNSNNLMQAYLNRTPTGSDATIKENIRKIGVLDNGLNLYKFEYQAPYKDTWGHGEHIGVMAQEVEKLIPAAVSTHSDGYKVVDYALIY